MFDAYKIGITVSLTNHVSKGLEAMALSFAKTDAQAAALQRRITGIKETALKGGMMMGVGVGMLALFKAPLEEAKKFDQAVGKFKLFGLGDAANADAVRFAKSMDVMGTSYTDNMKLMTEAQGVFRESGLAGLAALDGAKLATPMLAKIQFATESLDDDSKAKMHTQSLAMLRFIEMRGGLKDAATFNSIADSGWKAIQSSGGNINWEQLRQFMARGGVAAQGLSNEALFGKLEPVIGELKGSTAGNAWMTAYNRLTGGVRVPNQVAHMLADQGIWDKSKIEWNSQGGIKQFNGNPLKDMGTLSTDPVAFYEKNILPMYAKMNGGKGLDTVERGRENLMIFGRTGGAMFSMIDRQLAAIHRSVDAQNKAQGVDQSVKTAGETLAGKEVDLHAKWAKTLQNLGDVVLPAAIYITEKLTGALSSLSGWMERNKKTTELLVGAFAALGVGLMIRGGILLLSAALDGLGLSLMMRSAGGAAGISRVALAIGASEGLAGALGGLAAIPILPIVVGLAALAAVIWGISKIPTPKKPDEGALIPGGHGSRYALPGSKGGSESDKAQSWWESAKKSFSLDNKDPQGALIPGGHGSRYPAGYTPPAAVAPATAQAVDASAGAPKTNAAWPAEAFRVSPKSNNADAANKAFIASLSDMLAAKMGGVTDSLTSKINGAKVVMDGTTVGNLILDHMSREASRPSTGTSSFDTRLSPLRPDFGF